MSTLNIPFLYRRWKRFPLNYRHLLPGLASWLTLSGSNYPCLEQISMVPKMFEPLKFDCMYSLLFIENFVQTTQMSDLQVINWFFVKKSYYFKCHEKFRKCLLLLLYFFLSPSKKEMIIFVLASSIPAFATMNFRDISIFCLKKCLLFITSWRSRDGETLLLIHEQDYFVLVLIFYTKLSNCTLRGCAGWSESSLVEQVSL